MIKDMKIEKAAHEYANRTKLKIGGIDTWAFKQIFIDGVNYMKDQIKNDLIDALNHIDALDCNIGLANTKNQDLENTVKMLKVSLTNLRKLL